MRIFKKILSVILCVVMMIGSAPLSGLVGLDLFSIKVSAANWGFCGEDLMWTFNTSEDELIISGTGDMTNWSSSTSVPWYGYRTYINTIVIENSVTSIGDHAFELCHGLDKVTIGNSVTRIGDYAFGYCDRIEIVNIPDSVTSIGNSAFSSCRSLTSITIPNSVPSIGESAFSNCDSLTSITIPDSVTTIGDDAFYDCDNLMSITIPDSVTTIGNRLFYDCDSLKNVTISDSVTNIGSSMFYNCTGLTYITIPDSVTSISDSAFADCDRLTSITIPSSVKSIGSDAFSCCFKLNDVYYSGDLAGWCGINFVEYDSNPIYYADNLYIAGNLLSGDILFPDSIASIGDYAFYNCDSFTSITITDSIMSIGDYAFYDCNAITRVVIGNSVTSIGNCAFENCGSITDIYYTGELAGWCGICFENLYANPIYYADNLYIDGNLLSEDIIFSDPITSICNYAFYDCDNLTTITIKDSVKSIGSYAFYGCDSLTNITISNSVTNIGSCAFSSCDGFTNITIPNSVERVGYGVFYDCDSLTSIALPDSVTSIGISAFEGCTNLSSITIPDSVTSIDYYAFYNCDSLETVYYSGTPEQWKNISIESYNSSLTSATRIYECNSDRTYYLSGSCGDNLQYVLYVDGELVISGTGGMTNWSSSSVAPWYKYRSHIKTVTILDSVTSIGDYAFYDCDILTSIKTPNGLTNIGSYAFYNCTILASMTIGDSVTNIGDYAFYKCDRLETVYYIGTPEQWKKISIGSNNSSLTSATIIYDCNSDNPYSLYGTCGTYLEWILSVDGDLVISGTGDMTNWSYASSVPWSIYRSNIKTVTIGDSVTSIGDHAFDYCDSLTSITIGDSVTSIGDYVFRYCDSLTDVYYTGDFTGWCGISFSDSYANPMFYADNLYIDENLISGDVVIPEGVTSIGNYAFNGYSNVTSVTIPDSVTSIGNDVFRNCDNLTSITIGDSVTSIGDYTFYGCDSLTDVYYTGDLSGWCRINFVGFSANPLDYEVDLYIDGELLSGDIVIPEGVTSIGNWSFRYCDSITSVTIPDSVTSIGESAFLNCYSLMNVYYTGDLAGWCGISFDNSYANPIYYADNLYIGGKLLSGDIVIPEGVTSIGSYAFEYCENLTSVTIPDSITSIGDYAFCNCTSLTKANYPGTYEQWQNVFVGVYNNNLTSNLICNCFSDRPYYGHGSCGTYLDWILYADGELVISGQRNMTDWSSYADVPWYSYRSHIKTVTIGNLVTSIGDYAFYNCSDLTSVKIPDSVTSIGDWSFGYCTGLTSVTIGSDIKSIGDYAFEGCRKLVNVYYNGTELQWVKVSIGSTNSILASNAVKFIHVHEYTENIIKQPTCTEKGSKKYTCDSCGHSYTDDIPATKHSYKAVVTPNTCTQDGYTTHTCSACGDIYVDGKVGAIGHDIIIDEAVEATCTATGLTEGQHCSRCDDATVAQEIIPALNHKDTLVQVEAKAPTCTEIGWDAYEYCTACEYTTYAEKEALNHDIIIDEAVESTCTETGLTAGQHCSRCDNMTVEQEVVPVKPHNHTAKHDSAKHWEECVCGSKINIQNHSFVGGNTCSCGFEETVKAEIAIVNNTGSKTINYGENLKLTATVTNKPSNAKIYWYVDGAKAGEGEVFSISFENGTKIVTVKLVDENGVVYQNANGDEVKDSENVTVNGGFFQKIISFFKNLFGINRTVVQ